MGCGGCGGGAAKTMQRRVVGAQQSRPNPTTAPRPIQAPRLRPTPTSRIVISVPTSTLKVKQQLKDLKVCPLCGSPLSPVMSGSGARNRKQCSRCNRTFV